MQRVRFEPIDIENLKLFEDLYNSLRVEINGQHGKEIMPAINRTYTVDDDGLPIR